MDGFAAIACGSDHHFDHVNGNGKADAVATAGLRIDGRVDADEATIHVNQRTAGTAVDVTLIALDSSNEIQIGTDANNNGVTIGGVGLAT